MFDFPDQDGATRPVQTSGSAPTQPVPVSTTARSEQPLDESMASTMPVNINAGETVPLRSLSNESVPPPLPDQTTPTDTSRPKRMIGRIVLMGILVVLLLGSVGGWLGYNDGINSRKNQQSSQVAVEAATQFQLGLQSQAEGRLDEAKSRFEYIISIDPNFPGVRQKLAEVLFALAKQANPTPTVEPMPTQVPTPNTSNEETQFGFVLQQMAKKNWDGAIVGMDGLRKINLNYKAIEVDGLYFIALRFRGVDKILKYSDLEGGIFDLSQAEKFTILDREADGWRLYARIYLTGAAYWEVNWEKATEYFAQVAPQLPNMRDTSGMTAIERYRIAGSKVAESYIKNDEYCKASKLLEAILVLTRNPTLEATATKVANDCNPPATKTPSPAPTVNTPTITNTLKATTPISPSPTGAGATATFTATKPSSTPTPVPPSSTPVPPSRTPTK